MVAIFVNALFGTAKVAIATASFLGVVLVLAVLVKVAALQFVQQGRPPRMMVSLSLVLRLVGWIVASLGIVLVVAGPYIIANHASAMIDRGAPVNISVLPGITGLSVEQVFVTTYDGISIGKNVPSGTCLDLLGIGSGTAVFFDQPLRLVIRVPESRISLEQPCPK
jgi:hypothetical protein